MLLASPRSCFTSRGMCAVLFTAGGLSVFTLISHVQNFIFTAVHKHDVGGKFTISLMNVPLLVERSEIPPHTLGRNHESILGENLLF